MMHFDTQLPWSQIVELPQLVPSSRSDQAEVDLLGVQTLQGSAGFTAPPA
jgi:hypothetical protein